MQFMTAVTINSLLDEHSKTILSIALWVYPT